MVPELDKMSNTIFNATIAFIIVNALGYVAWAGVFMLNSLPIINGLEWWLMFAISLNMLLPLTLLAALARSKRASSADLHIVLSWGVFIVNIVVFIVLGFMALFYLNTGLAGGSAFNDYRWCGVFFGSSYCPNTVGFGGLNALDLRINVEFWGHFWFTSAFLLISAIHIGSNKLLRQNGIITGEKTRANASEGNYIATMYVVVFLIVYAAWASLPLLNTIVVHGYPRFPIPPVPNTFESVRYGFQYWMITLLSINIVPIYLFFSAVTRSNETILSAIFLYTTPLFAIGSAVLGFILLWILIVGTNNALSAGSISNSYLYCHQFYNSVLAYPYCANVTPFPGVINLGGANPEFIAHLVFAFVFTGLHSVGIWVHYRMRIYGVF